MKCIITSKKKTKIYTNLESIILTTDTLGELQILSNYSESFLLIKKGKIILKYTNKKKQIINNTYSGECHIKDDIIRIIL